MRFFLVSLSLLITKFVIAQNANTWQMTISEASSNLDCRKVVACKSNGFLGIGSITSTINNDQNVYLARFDNNGKAIWLHSYGDTNANSGIDGLQLDNGDFLIGGNTTSPTGDKDVFLMKTDSNGIVLWTKHYHEINEISLQSLKQIGINSFYLASNAKDPISINKFNINLIKVDSSGNINLSKTYTNNNLIKLGDMALLKEGSVVLLGEVLDSNSLTGLFISKIDSTGSINWAKVYGLSTSYFVGQKIMETNNGEIIIGAATNPWWWFIKTDGNGFITWSKYLHNPHFGNIKSLVLNKDSSINALGISYSFNVGGGYMAYDVYNIRFSDNAIFSDFKKYEYQIGLGQTMICSNDNSYLICGNKKNYQTQKDMMFYVKTDNLGSNYCLGVDTFINSTMTGLSIATINITTMISSVSKSDEYYSLTTIGYDSITCKVNDIVETFNPITSISPNPTNSQVTIKGITQPTVVVYNLMGQKVVAAQGSNEVSLAQLPTGMYLVQVFNKDMELVKSEKVVLNR